jgi:DNA-binding NtrC family response regulator
MSTPRHQATVLVVDDEEAIRALAAQVLESRGYNVLVAADRSSALTIAADYPSAIHLLLTDIMMPLGDGISLSKAFLAKRPDTPVLYMSGFEPDTIQLVQNGRPADGPFLAKPFTPGKLIEQVEAMLPIERQEKPASPRADSAPPRAESAPQLPALDRNQSPEAVYRLESAAKCPQCGETITTLKAIRLLRTQVNFISTLPRRGRVAVCPECQTILPAELTNF